MAVPYREQAAPAALARWVECSWSIELDRTVVHRVAPDGCVDLVYSREEGLRAVGTMTAEQGFELKAGSQTIGVRFHPGMARAFLRAAPGSLTDGMVSLGDLWGAGGRALQERLGNAESAEEALRVLRAALPVPEAAPGAVERAIEVMTTAHGCADLDEIARAANLSPRQFRRRCLEESGLTPKHLCRVLRFRQARHLAARVLRPEWSGIAADAGYFDQAHLIRDFREFTGRTPVAVFSNTGTAADR